MIRKAKKREWRFNYEADDKERRKLQLSVWEVSSTIEMGWIHWNTTLQCNQRFAHVFNKKMNQSEKPCYQANFRITQNKLRQ